MQFSARDFSIVPHSIPISLKFHKIHR